jgi:uncharacterized protein
MEAAIAHYFMRGGDDRRLVDAAFRLADCWVNNIGLAPKRDWYEGHAGLEQTLVRLATFSEEYRGPGTGRSYVELARFLLDARRDGEEYDQSHVPVIRQYEAVGHAVRAVYSYAGMASVAMEMADVDYHSALLSLWDNLVNRKYYLTGGVGSGETSEGFGKDYSLPNHSYCESCAGCGQLFFQHKMQLAHHDAKYADLMEETLYNAVLGSLDLEAQNFTYTNPLDSDHPRYKWHVCPCCIGNIPRTLLMLPTWMYSKDGNGLYVNLYAGSKANVGEVHGNAVQIQQETGYPLDGTVLLSIDPQKQTRFTLHLRVPNWKTSALYSPEPAENSAPKIEVNGRRFEAELKKGYVSISRQWSPGDKVKLAFPMSVQRVYPDQRIRATNGRVALRYGPLVYSIESVDQSLDSVLLKNARLATEWKPDLLGGVMVIRGTFQDGEQMKAIPHYARLNRGGRSIVWIKTE